MIFRKKIWRNGDSLTKDELNRIESGIHEALSKIDSSSLNLQIQAGRETIDTSSGTPNATKTFEKNITFDSAFQGQPYVFVVAETSSPKSVIATCKGSSYVNRTGFTVRLSRTEGSTVSPTTSVCWIAVAPA